MDGLKTTVRGILWGAFFSLLLWAGVLALGMALTGCGHERCPVVTIRACPICGDTLIGGGYCSTCKLWFEVVE